MKECDKRKSHICSKLHMIYISSNNGRNAVTKTSTSLHLSTLHFLPFKLHATVVTTVSFGLTPLKFRTAPFHLTSL